MQWHNDGGNTIVEVEIMNEKDIGERVLIPRIQLTSIDMYPFSIQRSVDGLYDSAVANLGKPRR